MGHALMHMHMQDLPMSRRRFGRMLAGIVIAPPSMAFAQASKVVRRIGVLDSGSPDIPQELRQAEALRELGWVEGQNLHVERRNDNGRSEALPALAEELVRAKVELIVTLGTPATLAAKRATTTIPVVFSAGDPVLLGLVASLAQPGGNLTGISQVSPEVTAKYLSVLKELLPRLERIGVLWEVGHPYFHATRGQFEHVCKSLGLTPIIVEVSAADEISRAIAQLERQRAQALVVGVGSFTWDHRLEIVDAATKQRLPTMTDDPEFVREAGALIAYTRSQVEHDRLHAEYIDRILRGARPADLPVRQPTKFELLINLKTARALGLTIPKELLLRADEVIR
jgi:putative tryptophan/tyrosine transport system substrate-binding protein